TSTITLPLAASIHAAGGSFFHSDMKVFNRSATDTVTVIARYRCFSGNCGNPTQTFTLAPREERSFDAVVSGLFGVSDSGGAIELEGPDTLVVTSRLYTPNRP